MIVKKYRSRIFSILSQGEGIYTIEFESLNGKFKYLPGQFLHLALDLNYDGSSQWPDSRCFSIQTSPGEDRLKITYSAKGQFTRQMESQLKTGNEVWLKLPYGSLFTQNHNKSHSVFISGGTGITPFLSLFTDNTFIQYKRPKLYAGFRNRKLLFCKEELEKAKKINAEFNVIYVFQDTDGILDIKGIHDDNKNFSPEYFISGPPEMIRSFKMYLVSNGVNQENVLTDEWE